MKNNLHTYEEYIETFDRRLGKYIPSRNEWSPVEEAVYGPKDLYRIPLAEAEALQMRAIRFSFECHYENNPVYRAYCQEHGVSPPDLRTLEDLEKIPLLPDRFFKNYPEGRDFAAWLGNIFTGDLPRIVIRRENPTFEEVVHAFNAAGLSVAYSSGTGGRHTVIPRDRRTYSASEYTIAKSAINMAYPYWSPDIHGYLLMPNPRKTNVFAGKVCDVYFDAIDDVRVAINRDVSAEVMRISMGGQKGLRNSLIRLITRLGTDRMVNAIIRWLEYHEKRDTHIALVGAPFIVVSVMKKLEERGRRFNFAGRGGVITGGGWKVYEGNRVPSAQFRQEVGQMLGFLPEHCFDVYGMVEGNGWMVQCPEGHYLHIPYSYYRPLVVDQNLRPLGYGEWGRYAFLDAAATSYPGFILSGDEVRMLERCPVCDRPGPVLEPEVRRATGEELRGCGEEVRRMLSADVKG